MLALFKFLYLISIVVWVGMLIFFSFVAAPAIFATLPRNTAGEVVGAIFPKYWLIGYICAIVSVISLVVIFLTEGRISYLHFIVLFLMAGLVFYTGLFPAKRARDIKARLTDTENEHLRAELEREFKNAHRESSIMNIITIGLGIVVIFLTSMRL
ncbi:MAG TPA: DUF4149 domain-containing protein [Deltaproteobacteria bacterium]|nr:DUF4149 domain-containing protein [Deltaproteobacteria bacterium]